MDDAAVLGDLVFTHDMIAEGVHFLPDDPPGDVAWKLVAVNLSDLAAKGAEPVGVLMGYALTGDADWDARFVAGLGRALEAFGVPLFGGDTIALREGPRVLGLTAVGRSTHAPARSGARAGDSLYVTGTIGCGGLGLAGDPDFLDAYRRPRPLLVEGKALAPLVHAMMDVSDGLLIDASRMAEASGLAVSIDLDAVPVAAPWSAGRDDRLRAVTAGDDYQLLFAAAPGAVLPVPAARIGAFGEGAGLSLSDGAGKVPLPGRLGWLHG